MAAPDLLSNPIFLMVIVTGVVVILVAAMFKKQKVPGFKDFKPKLFGDTAVDGMKEKMNKHGTGFGMFEKPKLYVGMKEVARVDKYYTGSGKFSIADYDPKMKDFKISKPEDDEEYDLLFIRAKSNNVVWRLLGMKKTYFILKRTDDKGNSLVRMDTKEKRFFLPPNTDLISYGNVWTNTSEGIEYINDISTRRMNEQIATHLENMPDRVVHLEAEQAKTERTNQVFAKIEKAKYDEYKKAGDTRVS